MVKTVTKMQRRQLELKAMTALVGPKDKYTGMLLTAVPYGRKTEILLNQIEGLAGWAWTKMSLVKELCNFCVCVNVEMSNHIKILFFFHNWSYLALNIDCVFLCLLPFWELKDLKPEPGQYHPTCAIWDFFFFHFVLPLSALPLSATSHFYKCWVFFFDCIRPHS